MTYSEEPKQAQGEAPRELTVVQEVLPLNDRPVQVVSILPREPMKPSPEEEQEFESTLDFIRRIMREGMEE